MIINNNNKIKKKKKYYKKSFLEAATVDIDKFFVGELDYWPGALGYWLKFNSFPRALAKVTDIFFLSKRSFVIYWLNLCNNKTQKQTNKKTLTFLSCRSIIIEQMSMHDPYKYLI